MIMNFGPLGSIVAIGILILLCFIIIKFFKAIFSMSFVGFVLALVSYFVYDYIFATVPVFATIGFVLCLCGLSKSTVFGKLFAVFGILISAYIILTNYGLI